MSNFDLDLCGCEAPASVASQRQFGEVSKEANRSALQRSRAPSTFQCRVVTPRMAESKTNQKSWIHTDLWYWPHNSHSVSRSEGRKGSKFLLNLQRHKTCKSSVHESDLNHKNSHGLSINAQA